MDPGSDKKVDPELDPKAEENLEEADTKSVEVGGVEEFSKEVNGKKISVRTLFLLWFDRVLNLMLNKK